MKTSVLPIYWVCLHFDCLFTLGLLIYGLFTYILVTYQKHNISTPCMYVYLLYLYFGVTSNDFQALNCQLLSQQNYCSESITCYVDVLVTLIWSRWVGHLQWWRMCSSALWLNANLVSFTNILLWCEHSITAHHKLSTSPYKISHWYQYKDKPEEWTTQKI